MTTSQIPWIDLRPREDAAAVDAHRAAPHYAVWRAAADTLDSAIELIDCQPVFPSDPEYWTGR